MKAFCEVFSDMRLVAPEIGEKIRENSSCLQFDRNDTIDIAGKTPEHMVLITSGIVKSFRRTGQSTLITGFKGPGELIYHVGNLMESRPSDQGFKAVTSTAAIGLPYRTLHDLLCQYPELHYHVARLIDRRVSELETYAYFLAETTDIRINLAVKHYSRLLADIPRRQFCQFLRMSPTCFYGYIKGSPLNAATSATKS